MDVRAHPGIDAVFDDMIDQLSDDYDDWDDDDDADDWDDDEE